MHLLLHFVIPALVAAVFFRKRFKRAYLIMIATMIVDVDHLLADPIYDPNRCSVGFHPLHELPLIGVYFALCFFPKTRLIGIGLMIHMILDSMDCWSTNGVFFVSLV